ncbi:hypothetical protein SLS58_003857 [Diplodia intermedia]|uniref:Heterokaryon incompatibility domain-containing protein n=1 Tax=Diplodia intermedia TaxID=856260 RepID=A0ABR3TWF4_9PEZI
MSVLHRSIENVSYTDYNIFNEPLDESGMMASIKLGSDDGCIYGLMISDEVALLESGGASWSGISKFLTPPWPRTALYSLTIDDTIPGTIYMNHSEECQDRELILLSTPWLAPSEESYSPNWNFSSDFRAAGQVCTSKYYMANITVLAHLSDTSSELTFDVNEYRSKRIPVPESFFNVTLLQNVTLNDNWTSYIYPLSTRSRPAVGGLSALLGALHNFDMGAMLDDNALVAQATKIKQRFFGELLQSSLSRQGASNTEPIEGRTTVVKRRVVVITDIAIAILALLMVSFVLSLIAWSISRLRMRPLNLSQDPATVTCLTGLLARDYRTQRTLRALSQVNKTELYEKVKDRHYFTTVDELHELSAADVPYNDDFALNGSQPAWSLDGWSFVPIDMDGILDSDTVRGRDELAGKGLFPMATNVTVSTPGIRGRIECTPYDNLDNFTAWLTEWDLTNSTVWNVSSNPKDADTGYELRNGQTSSLFANNFFDTSFLGNPSRPTCCANDSASGSAQAPAAIGYWSPFDAKDFPFPSSIWPRNFTTKWIYGNLRDGYNMSTKYRGPGSVTDSPTHMLYTERPSIQALHCAPIIESATAEVTVDQSNGKVQSFTILDEPTAIDAPWTDGLLRHEAAAANRTSDGDPVSYNVTASYGVLFLTALLGASDLANIGGAPDTAGYADENTLDATFNMRDRAAGLDADFMSYAMHRLAGGRGDDARTALLDADAMRALADATFATFFQHYVSSNVSLAAGGGHCWGPPDKHPLRTTTATLDKHLKGIEFEQLPKTFQDAAIVTRALGLKYPWIDSLCILQDNEDEWREEVGKTGSLYQLATLTVAASGAHDSTSGCDKSKNWRLPSIRTPHYNHAEDEAPSGYINAKQHLRSSPAKGPLHKRARAVLERHSSRRTVHLTGEGPSRQCNETSVSDTGPESLGAGRQAWARFLQDYNRESRAEAPSWSWASGKGPMYFWTTGTCCVGRLIAPDQIDGDGRGTVEVREAKIGRLVVSGNNVDDYCVRHRDFGDFIREIQRDREAPLHYIHDAEGEGDDAIGVAALDCEVGSSIFGLAVMGYSTIRIPGKSTDVEKSACNCSKGFKDYLHQSNIRNCTIGKSDLHTDDTTFLRGIWPSDADGVLEMKTVFPGFYAGRTIYTNWTLHGNGTFPSGHVASTGQLYFDERVRRQVMAHEPYRSHTETERVANDDDHHIGKGRVGGCNPVVIVVAANGEDLGNGMIRHIIMGVDTAATYEEAEGDEQFWFKHR